MCEIHDYEVHKQQGWGAMRMLQTLVLIWSYSNGLRLLKKTSNTKRDYQNVRIVTFQR